MTEIDESVLLEDSGDQQNHEEHEIDENSLLEVDSPVEAKEDVEDLYDDAIAPTNVSLEQKDQKVETTPTPKPATTVYQSHPEGKKFCVYVGNLHWFATDADLMKAIASTDIPYDQLVDMKFFENRTNGQSKGYALAVFNSEAAVKKLMETLPTKYIHGQQPSVLSYNKANQAKLEEATGKRGEPKKKTTDDGRVDMGTIRIGAGSVSSSGRPQPLMSDYNIIRQPQPLMSNGMNSTQPPVQMRLQINGQPVQPPQMMSQLPPQNMIGGMQMGAISSQQVPNMMGGRPMMQQTAPLGMMGMNTIGQSQYQTRPPPMASMGGQPQPLMQMNTSIRPPMNGMPPVHVNPQMFPGMQGPPLSDAEYEDVVNRNRTVSSSAISRATSDASIGDINGASEVLLTAIALIKQSRAGHDERCRQLVYALEDTLKIIESKGYSSSRSRSHRDHRDRSRSRDRKRRRRSRSRSYSRSPSPRRSRRY